jgi:hypothetical protein
MDNRREARAMIDEGSKQALISAVRSILIAAGSMLAMKGLVDDTTWSQVVGGVTTILTIGWGIWDKYRSEQATKVREAVAVGAGIAAAHSGMALPPAAPPAPPTAAEIIKEFAPKDGAPPAAAEPAAKKLPFGVAKP